MSQYCLGQDQEQDRYRSTYKATRTTVNHDGSTTTVVQKTTTTRRRQKCPRHLGVEYPPADPVRLLSPPTSPTGCNHLGSTAPSLRQPQAIEGDQLSLSALSLGPPLPTGHYFTSSVCSGTNVVAVAPQPGAVVPTMFVSMSSPLAGVVQTVAAPVMFAPQGSSYFVPSIGSYRNGGFVYKGITYGPGQYHNPPLCETGYIEDYASESSYPDDESDARSTSTYVSNATHRSRATLGGYRGWHH